MYLKNLEINFYLPEIFAKLNFYLKDMSCVRMYS